MTTVSTTRLSDRSTAGPTTDDSTETASSPRPGSRRSLDPAPAALASLPAREVGEVIPRFHDPVARFEAFRAALTADPRIGRERHALIMSGVAILQTLMRVWPTRRLSVADRGLREGLLYAQMVKDGVLAPDGMNGVA